MIERLGAVCLFGFLFGSILLFIACNVLTEAVFTTEVSLAGFFLLVVSPIGMAISALARHSQFSKISVKRERDFFDSLQKEVVE